MCAKILFLDDEEIIRDMLTQLLDRAGHRIIAVPTGEEAVEEYKKHFETGEKFDMVLLDLSVPLGKGGKEIMPELLDIDPDIIAIIASGSDTNPAVKEYKKYGFTGVLMKPFSRAAVLLAIEQYAPHAV